MEDRMANKAALVAKVSQVLLSHECQRINFCWGQQRINAKAYRAVVLALADSRIHLYEANAKHKLDDGVEASYSDSGDTMIIHPHLNLHKVSNRRTIVHEATHAVQDAELADVDVWRLDKEAIAFVAEWLYLIYSSPDPDNLRNDPNPNDPIEVIALEIAQSSPLAVLATRETVRRGLCDEIEAATERELVEQDWLRQTEDFREGIKAYGERRLPNFQGR